MSKIKNGGLDQYGAGPFEQHQFGTAGVEGVKNPLAVSSKRQKCIENVLFKSFPVNCYKTVQEMCHFWRHPMYTQHCPNSDVLTSAIVVADSLDPYDT